jgi:hypothetical protein
LRCSTASQKARSMVDVFMGLLPRVVMPRLVRNCALGRGIQYSRESEFNR